MYNLRSVVMHSGTATDGHYFCYSHVGGSSSTSLSSTRQWALLDDNCVTLCSQKRVFYEAASASTCDFNLNRDAGAEVGVIDEEEEDEWTVDSDTNAYMLFYSKVTEDGCDEELKSIPELLTSWVRQRDILHCIGVMLE